MATKYLERIEGAHRNGNISDAEYNQAKQRKLEAELELQRTRTAASGDNPVRVRKSDDWTPTLFARAK
jgi:hypothetical protein